MRTSSMNLFTAFGEDGSSWIKREREREREREGDRKRENGKVRNSRKEKEREEKMEFGLASAFGPPRVPSGSSLDSPIKTGSKIPSRP